MIYRRLIVFGEFDLQYISNPLLRTSPPFALALQKVYEGVTKLLLFMLRTAEGLVVLSSQPDVLSLLIRSLVSLSSDCDFTSSTLGELKPFSIQFDDLLPLPVCWSKGKDGKEKV